MGTLGGHILPGTFFILFALRWSFNAAVKYVQSNLETSKYPIASSNVKYEKATFATKLKQAPIESIRKALLAVGGILGEIITGIHWIKRSKYEVLMTHTAGQNVSIINSMNMEHTHQKRDTYQSEQVETLFFLPGNGKLTIFSYFRDKNFLKYFYINSPAYHNVFYFCSW